MTTAFFTDERTFWHSGGNYAFLLPVGGYVQPMVNGGLPETPESKRRLCNLMQVSGLMAELDLRGALEATKEDLLRIHPESYLSEFKSLSDAGGGELGRRTPFGQGGYEIASLSAGLCVAAVEAVLSGQVQNAYALTRPPGHHCLPDFPNGFCLMANIPIAIEAARAKGHCPRVAVLDWDVHHGNGTEAIYYEDPNTLTISLHQEGNYPLDTGDLEDRGKGAGNGTNINLPLPAGSGHTAYLHALDRIALPAIEAFQPDLIIVACGYDAAAIDPLARMLATAQTFAEMTQRVKALADKVCDGRLVLAHEGGYSEVYVPFCGHATIATLAGSTIHVEDPFEATFARRQPGPALDSFLISEIDRMAQGLGF